MTIAQFSIEKKIIEDYVHKIILAWLEDRIEEVDELIDNKITFCSSVGSRKYSGKSQFKEYLYDSLINKKVIRYNEEDFSIHTDGITATAHYKFIMEYQQNNKNVIESGRDFFLFKREMENWKLVWRSIYYYQ
ncbi:MAG: hypothetical protein AB1521_07215 [Bacteroidota bacterium]